MENLINSVVSPSSIGLAIINTSTHNKQYDMYLPKDAFFHVHSEREG